MYARRSTGHVLIAPSADGRIYAFDADPESDTEGEVLWVYPLT